jgi:hypothetical protein
MIGRNQESVHDGDTPELRLGLNCVVILAEQRCAYLFFS